MDIGLVRHSYTQKQHNFPQLLMFYESNATNLYNKTMLNIHIRHNCCNYYRYITNISLNTSRVHITLFTPQWKILRAKYSNISKQGLTKL